jgi:hypothetical protein
MPISADCRHFGEVILPDAWGGVRWMAVEDAGLADILTRTGPPVPMPDTEGFTIGHLTAAEVAAKVSELDNAHLTSDNDELQELLDEYRAGFARRPRNRKQSSSSPDESPIPGRSARTPVTSASLRERAFLEGAGLFVLIARGLPAGANSWVRGRLP